MASKDKNCMDMKETLLLDGWTEEKEHVLWIRLAHSLPVTNFIVLLSSFWGRFSSFEFLLLLHYKIPNLVMQLLKPIK